MPGFDDVRREEQGQAFDASPQQASDTFRQEAYSQQRMEQQAYAQSVRSPNFDNPVNHLDRARQAWQQGGFRAAEQYYFSAIRAADSIDQREVARERQQVRQQMQTEQDPNKRRQLAQWDMSLHDMQRAPGFTRANLGLAYLRVGYQSEGVRMLMEASVRDPEMANDPNFVRRMRALDQSRMPGRQPGYPQQGPYDQRQPGYPQQGPYDQRQPQGPQQGPYDQRQPQGPQQGPYDQRQPQGPQQGFPQRGADYDPHAAHRGRARGDAPSQPAPQQGGDRIEPPSGNNRPDAQNFDNPFAHIAKANEGFSKNGNKLTPEAKAEYEAAIKAADTLDRRYIADQMKALQEALDKAYPKETQDRVAALEKERDDILSKLPQDKKDKIAELGQKLAAATTDEERTRLKKEMRDLVPDAAAKQDQIDQLTAQPKAIAEQLEKLKMMFNSSALARFAYADALRQSGDKANAKTMLEQVAKLDPTATTDDKFKEAARDVGLTITPPSGDKPAEARLEQPGTTPTGDAAQADPFELLAAAHEKEGKEGFAAAKPLYEQAVAAADKIDQAMVAAQLKKIEEALKDPNTDAATKEKQQQLGALWVQYQHAPFISRFQLAVAMNNAGDSAGAKTLFEAAAKLDAEAAKEPTFLRAVELAGKGEKITEEELKKVAQAAPSGGPEVKDNPYTHYQAALDAEKAGNNATAGEMYKKAIEAADKLPIEDYKKQLEQVDAAIKAEKDPVKSQQLVEQKKALSEIVGLSAMLRVDAATFHLRNARPDEAKQLLEQALAKEPTLKDNPKFKEIAQIAQSNSADTITKSIDFLKSAGKELVGDFTAGGVGMAVVSLTPGGRFLKLGAGLLAGGATKYAFNSAFNPEKASLGRDMLWGGVDTLAFVSGAGVRKNLMGRFEAGLGKEGVGAIGSIAREGEGVLLKNLTTRETSLVANKAMLEKALGTTTLEATEREAVTKALAGTLSSAERKGLASIFAGTATEAERKLLTDRVAAMGLQQEGFLAERALIQEQVAKLTGENAPKGIQGLQAATDLLTRGVQGQKDLAATELRNAIAAAPAWQKPLLWTQGHLPLAWRIPNSSLAGFKSATAEALSTQGSRFQYLNPRSMFGSVDNYSTLKSLEARTFWKRYGVDAASIGATSLIYRGTHEGARVGDVDPLTGKTYSVYDAVTSTAMGTATDALTGGFLVAGFRGMGGFFTKHAGATGEVNPLTRPTLGPNPSMYGRVTQPLRLLNYGAQRYIGQPIGNYAGRAGSWLASDGRLQAGLSAVPTGAVIFSPKLYEAYTSWEKVDEYEKILAQINKPLTDKGSLPEGPTTPAPTADKPAAPADKPAEAPAPTNNPDGGNVNGGLPE